MRYASARTPRFSKHEIRSSIPTPFGSRRFGDPRHDVFAPRGRPGSVHHPPAGAPDAALDVAVDRDGCPGDQGKVQDEVRGEDTRHADANANVPNYETEISRSGYQTVLRTLTLDQAVQLALKQNPDILKALQQIQVTKGQIFQVAAQGVPQLIGTGNFTNTDNKLLTVGTTGSTAPIFVPLVSSTGMPTGQVLNLNSLAGGNTSSTTPTSSQSSSGSRSIMAAPPSRRFAGQN